MEKRNNEEQLSEKWDTNASASDNESFDLEIMQDDSMRASSTNKELTEKKANSRK